MSHQRAMRVALLSPEPADISKNAMKDKTASATEPVFNK